MARPLTRLKHGVPYSRPPDVEAQIDEVLRLDRVGLRRRLLITSKGAPGYVRSETLVNLTRDAHRLREGERRDEILRVLLGRCEAILTTGVSHRLPNAEQIREDALSDFLEILVADGTAENPDELDYYECKFESGLRTLRIDAIRRELKVVNGNVDLECGDVDEPAADGDTLTRVSAAFRDPDTPQSVVFMEELWVAINALPFDERKAVVLVHILGFDEESETDPEKVTAATLCHCTGRTIRNRLSRAAKKLARFKENT